MIETFKNAFKIKEVRAKIWWTILFVIIYRLGCYIPVPGFVVNISELSSYNLLSILDAISGSALSDGTLFAIGITPYINASIIMQLLTVAIPALEKLSKEGEDGRHKIDVITRWVTLGLAIVSAVGIVFSQSVNANFINATFFPLPEWLVFVYVTIVLVAGAMLCMWIGERITEYGVSNGISLLIFVGLLTSAGKGILQAISGNRWGELAGFMAVLIVIFGFIVWVDGAERKVKVQYAKQVKGNKMYGGQSTYIPIKVNAAGVMPLIFAFALMSFPTMLIQTFWSTAASTSGTFAYWWINNLGAGSWAYQVILAAMIFLFAFFYSQIQFNPLDISKNIQQNGGFIPGIRPGRETSDYLSKVIFRITFWGAVFLAIVALVPSLIFSLVTSNDQGLLNAFSSTGMLICVSVALEFFRALENQILMRHYKGFLK